MNNEEKLKNVFAKGLDLPLEQINDDLEYLKNEKWDSLSHLRLISVLENTFEVSLDTNDILAINSYAIARSILQKNYNIAF